MKFDTCAACAMQNGRAKDVKIGRFPHRGKAWKYRRPGRPLNLAGRMVKMNRKQVEKRKEES